MKSEEYSKDEMGMIQVYPEARVLAEDKYQISKLMEYASLMKFPALLEVQEQV